MATLLEKLEERVQKALDALAALPTIVLPDDATDREVQEVLATLTDNQRLLQDLLDAQTAYFDEAQKQHDSAIVTDVVNNTAAGAVSSSSPTDCSSDQFQGIRFYDGTSFGYLRVYADKVQLLVDQTYEFELDGTMLHTYRLTGNHDDIRLYVDGQLAINATGGFTQPTSTKLIEFGDIAGRNQNISSEWDSFKYTTTGDFPPANTEDLLLEQTISFPDASVGRLKTYDNALYVSVDPLDPDRSTSIYRFEEGQKREHRSVLAITKASVSAVLIDPNRNGSAFDTTGKYLATDNGLQYLISSKPFPYDFVTSFSQDLDGNGWALDGTCEDDCESLTAGVLTIDTTGEANPVIHKYKQDLPSDSWVDGAKNKKGWTVECKVKVIDDGSGGTIDAKASYIAGNADIKDCGQTPASTGGQVPDEDNIFAPGIYINDGTFQEVVQFFQKGVRLKYSKLFGTQDLTDQFYTVRILGKGRAIAVYVKGENDAVFKQILFSSNALGVTARFPVPQEKPALYADDAGIIHTVWQEAGDEGISIFYNRLNRHEVTTGSGLVGSKEFDSDNNLLSTRIGLGLPPAPDINYKAIANNVVIAAMALFKTKGVKEGDILQIFFDTSSVRYVIKQVIDEVLLELDTSDDLSQTKPSDWLIVSGESVWGSAVRVSTNPFDSQNARILNHSNGSIYVAYDNNEHGNSEIYLRRGVVTATGTNWASTIRLTNSSHDAKSPDIVEMSNGNILLIWQDSSNDATGSQIFYKIITPNLDEPQNFVPKSFNEDSLHARNPHVASNKQGDLMLVYEDDINELFEIFAISITEGSTELGVSTPVLVSSGSKALNAALAKTTSDKFYIAWESYELGNPEIYGCEITGTTVSNIIRYTDARNSSKYPSITADSADQPVIVYQSDRTRPGYNEIYVSKIALNADGDQLVEASGGIGLDVKVKTYLTQNTHPAIALMNDGNIAIVWEGTKDDRRQTIFGTIYDSTSTTMDKTVLGYFPLNEDLGTEFKNRITGFDQSGFIKDPINGMGFHGAEIYSTDAVNPEGSLFNPLSERGMDFGQTGGDGFKGGFSINTANLIRESGAIDMYVKPHWASDDTDPHIFFGNAALDSTDPNTMVFGSDGTDLKFRVVDEDGTPHETVINSPDLWDAEQAVHLRAIWDSTNIGIQSIIGSSFVNTTTGFICGPTGSIFKTLDGGSTWVKNITGLTYDIYSIDFFDVNTGFACGELGTVLLTLDSGDTWTTVNTGLDVDLKSIYFRTALIGYAVGADGTILYSTDGGNTWIAATVPTSATETFTSVAVLTGGTIIAVGKGQVVLSTDDGITYENAENIPDDLVDASWNAISRTNQGGVYATYIVGNSGAMMSTGTGVAWTDISADGPDLVIPNLLCVSAGSTSSTLWVPWGIDKLAFSTDGGDTFSFIDTDLNGFYRSVDANFGGLGDGTSAVVTGIGGTMMLVSASGSTQTFSRAVCANLTIIVDGIEPEQTRSGDCSFAWDPTETEQLFFGDRRLEGDEPVDAVVDEVVIYSTPTPGFSAMRRHEFRTFQTNPTAIITDDSGKRIEFGSISPYVKTKTQWKEFKTFYCGAREPVQHFAWNTTTGLVDDVVLDFALDQNGYLWLATNNGISRFAVNSASECISAYLAGRPQPELKDGLFLNYTNLGNNLIADTVTSITVDEDNTVWAGTSKGLMYLKKPIVEDQADPVNKELVDSLQTILDQGSTVSTQEQFQHLTKDDGLPSNNILVVKALKGAIFVGTDNGLALLTAAADATAAKVITVFSTKDGLPSNRIQSVAQENNGNIWIGTDKGLIQFKAKNSVIYNTNNGLISRDVKSITIDETGRKYVGTGFGLTRIDGSNFKTFQPSSGIGQGAINCGAVDSTGSLWFATSNGLVQLDPDCDGETKFTLYGLQDGIIGDNNIRDYERYRILGGSIETGGCNKALVTVAVNGRQLSTGFTVNPNVPWIIFDNPLTPSDIVEVCVQNGWRKVHDFNFDKRNNTSTQAVIETETSKYNLFRKRMAAGTVALGANFAQGAANNSTSQYGVFIVPLPGIDGPSVDTVAAPTSAELTATVAIGDTFFSDSSEEITGLPQELIEAQQIKLSEDDADEISDDYLDFVLLVDSIVYVAYDSRASGIPEWLEAFERVPVVLRVSDMETFTDATNQEKLYVATQGTYGCVYNILHAPDVCDISDEIATDFTAPEGCATISKVNSRTSLTLAITATDAVTGVSEMQVSPRKDFTTDGTTDVPFVPYQTNYVFELPASATATTGDVAELPDDVVSGGTTTSLPDDIINNVFHDYLGTLLIGTKNPGRVYKFDQATSVITLLFETGEDEVLSMATFGNDLIVGTGTNGKAFKWNGTILTQLPTSVGERVMSAWVFANRVYLGYSPGGEIYTLDQFGAMELFMDTYETSVNAFATFGSKLYWSTSNESVEAGDELVSTTKKGHKHFITVESGTDMLSDVNGTTTEADEHTHEVIDGVIQPFNGHTHGLNGSSSGKIFRYDPASGQSIIIHSDIDFAVTALASTAVDSNGILFAGTSPHGKILRFIPDEEIFIKSFQTAKLTVNKLRFYSNMFALVDDDVYKFTGKRWEFVASVSDSVHDVAPEKSNTEQETGILVLRDGTVASTSTAPALLNTSLCAYVRFKDVAGNVSEIEDADGNLIECYAPCIDLTDGGGSGGGTGGDGGGLKIGKNRLLEVDSDSRVVFGLDGTEAFLSGNKIEQEVAVYYSEIFNGTNSFVQWVDLNWDATTPTGTSITIAVRSADTNAGIADADWSKEFTDPSANDITDILGQYLQFRATLKVTQQGVSSPVLSTVDISLRTSQAVHYFTTNFSLPDEMRRGLLTYNGCINPPVTDVIFGVCGLDSTDFADYYIISPDKVFELPSEHQTKNLRVGIKLISSPTEIAIVDEFALLTSLANDAKIKFNLAGQPTETTGQIATSSSTRTVTTERVQNHVHTISFDSTILDKTAINGTTSVNAGHQHEIIDGVVQIAAGHTHDFTL